MADRQFRFRLPWLTSSPATRPTAEPQPPARPTTMTVPIQRPPFRPAGIAPPQPPQIQAQPQRAEPPPQPIPQTVSLPASPTRATTQTRGSSVPPSPGRVISESRLTNQPTSPVRATSQTQSPSRAGPPSRSSSVPPSPTRTSEQPQSQRVSQRSPKASPSRIPTQQRSTVSERPSPPKKMLDTRKDMSASPPEEPKTEPVQPVGLVIYNETIKKISETDEPMKLGEKPKTEELKTDETKKVIRAESSAEPQGKGLEDAAVQGERRRKVEHIKTTSSIHHRAKHSIIDSHDKTFTSNGEQIPLHREIRGDISKLIHKVGTIQSNQPVDEKQVSVITLAGENKGATMHVGSVSAKKEESIHIHRGYKTNPDETTEGTTTDGEASSGGKRLRNSTKEEPATKAYINSNIQSVNNSMLFDSKVSEKDPGVHLEFSHDQAEPATPKPETVARKAEFSITLAQNLTYEPTVRRRCLRGLFLEPSDDELDSPDKPRRHGCRFTCGDNNKDIGIF